MTFTPEMLTNLAYFFTNTDRQTLEEAGIIQSGRSGDDKWERFNHNFDIFILKSDDKQLEALANLANTYFGKTTPPPRSLVMGGLALIDAERNRQIAKGYDASHDDGHKGGEIVTADWGARARIEAAINAGRCGDSPAYKELLAQAAAQCVAEIERVERAEGKANA